MSRRMSDREQIAAGCFYTEAELRAKPHLRRTLPSPQTPRRDPNDGPISQATLDLIKTGECCAWCMEPEDDDKLVTASNGSHVHEESCLTPMNEFVAARLRAAR